MVAGIRRGCDLGLSLAVIDWLTRDGTKHNRWRVVDSHKKNNEGIIRARLGVCAVRDP